MTAFESSSEISIRAEQLVTRQLHMWAKRERVIATELPGCFDAAAIQKHEFAAELYDQLIAAAPGIWHGRDEAIADAERVMDAVNAKAASTDGSQITALKAAKENRHA